MLPDIAPANTIKKLEKKEKKSNAQSFAKIHSNNIDLGEHNSKIYKEVKLNRIAN